MRRFARSRGCGGVAMVLLAMSSLEAGAVEKQKSASAQSAPRKATTTFSEAKPFLDRYRNELPADLARLSASELAAAWPGWLAERDREIRSRIRRGDEDSLVYLWHYGTSFTKQPRVTASDIQRVGSGLDVGSVLEGRLQDLLHAMAEPGSNERVRFAREVVERSGIAFSAPGGRDKAHDFLIKTRERVLAENEAYLKVLRSAQLMEDPGQRLQAAAAVYQDRGLSSDTSLTIDYTVEAALQAAKAAGKLGAGAIRRVGIVGPGLDFTDKAEGHDFYPEQSIQPFALMDSLIRLGLANPAELRVETLDLNDRINRHLEGARVRAAAGTPYTLQLLIDGDTPRRQASPGLIQYWKEAGSAIGKEIPPMAAPPSVGPMRARAIEVPPNFVLSILPRDLNIVAERFERVSPNEPFDLVLATNILLYYGKLEQGLALSNIRKMLRPSGFLLANYVAAPVEGLAPLPELTTKVAWDQGGNGDTVMWFQAK